MVVVSSSRLRSVAVSSMDIVPVKASLTGRGFVVSCSVIGRGLAVGGSFMGEAFAASLFRWDSSIIDVEGEEDSLVRTPVRKATWLDERARSVLII